MQVDLPRARFSPTAPASHLRPSYSLPRASAAKPLSCPRPDQVIPPGRSIIPLQLPFAARPTFGQCRAASSRRVGSDKESRYVQTIALAPAGGLCPVDRRGAGSGTESRSQLPSRLSGPALRADDPAVLPPARLSAAD